MLEGHVKSPAASGRRVRRVITPWARRPPTEGIAFAKSLEKGLLAPAHRPTDLVTPVDRDQDLGLSGGGSDDEGPSVRRQIVVFGVEAELGSPAPGDGQAGLCLELRHRPAIVVPTATPEHGISTPRAPPR